MSTPAVRKNIPTEVRSSELCKCFSLQENIPQPQRKWRYLCFIWQRKVIPVKVTKGEEILRNKLAQRHHIPARHYVSPSCHTLENCKSKTESTLTGNGTPRWMSWCLFLQTETVERSHFRESKPSERTFYPLCYLLAMRDFEQQMCVTVDHTTVVLSFQ